MRKLILTMIGTMLAISAAGTGTAQATRVPVNAAGTAHCVVSGGKAVLRPGYVLGGTATTVSFTLKAKLNCSGTSGVVSGKLIARGSTTTNDCLSEDSPPTFGSATVKWNGPGAKFNSSAISATNGLATISADDLLIQVPSPGPNPPKGTTSISGSFAGEHAVASLVTDQTGTEFMATCATKKGVKFLNFTGVHGPSTLDIG